MDEKVKQALLVRDYKYVPETGDVIGPRGKVLKLQKRGNYLSFGLQIGTYQKQSIRMVPVHQFAFFCTEGEWPAISIDHINRDPHDNRWCNLRKATGRQQQLNRNAKGFTVRTKRYKKPRYEVNCDHKYIGVFDTEIEARLAYKKALEAVKV
jgi:hypothetical protein